MMGPRSWVELIRQKRIEYLDRRLLAEFAAFRAEIEAFGEAVDRRLVREDDYAERRAAVERGRIERDAL